MNIKSGIETRILHTVLGAVLLFSASISTVRAEPVLNPPAAWNQCPFVDTTDPFSLQPLTAAVSDILQQKIDKRASCRAPIKEFLQTLNSTQAIFTKLSPADRNKALLDIRYQQQQSLAIEIAATRQQLEDGNLSDQARANLLTVYSSLNAAAQSLASTIREAEISAQNDELNFDREKQLFENNLRLQFYQQSKDVLKGLDKIPPSCFDLLGGIQSVAPTLLGLTSSLVGFSGTVSSPLLAAASDLGAQVAYLLADAKIKRALNAMQRIQNDQIVACAYYSARFAACEYQRGLDFYRRTVETEQILRRRPLEGTDSDQKKLNELTVASSEVRGTSIPPEYSEVLVLREILPRLGRLLDEISKSASAFAFNPADISSYFENKRKLSTFTGMPTSMEIKDLQDWLTNMRNSGFTIRDFDINGKAISVLDQYGDGKVQVETALSKVDAFERQMTATRSMVDLRMATDDSNLETWEDLKKFKEVLVAWRTKRPGRIASRLSGPLVVAENLIDKMTDYFSVSPYDKDCTPEELKLIQSNPELRVSGVSDCFNARVVNRGQLLFQTISSGSVAQVNSQTALSIGTVAYRRLIRAVNAIENRLVYESKYRPTTFKPNDLSYVNFLQERTLQFWNTRNLSYYTRFSSTFREDMLYQVETSLEKGFEPEILRSIENSIENADKRLLTDTSGIVAEKKRPSVLPGEPEPDAQTVDPKARTRSQGAVCALYSDFLRRSTSKKARRLLKLCEEKFLYIEGFASANIDVLKIKIDYTDRCFLVKTQRWFSAQELLNKTLTW